MPLYKASPIYGTWVPTIEGNSVAGNNTYATQIGRYSKIGKLVHAEYFIEMSVKDVEMAGVLRIAGLPFMAVGNPSANTGTVHNITMTVPYNNQIVFLASATKINMYGLSNGSFDYINVTGIAAGAIVQGAIDYLTA